MVTHYMQGFPQLVGPQKFYVSVRLAIEVFIFVELQTKRYSNAQVTGILIFNS